MNNSYFWFSHTHTQWKICIFLQNVKCNQKFGPMIEINRNQIMQMNIKNNQRVGKNSFYHSSEAVILLRIKKRRTNHLQLECGFSLFRFILKSLIHLNVFRIKRTPNFYDIWKYENEMIAIETTCCSQFQKQRSSKSKKEVSSGQKTTRLFGSYNPFIRHSKKTHIFNYTNPYFIDGKISFFNR